MWKKVSEKRGKENDWEKRREFEMEEEVEMYQGY